MYRFMILTALGVGLLFMVTAFVVKGNSDASVAEREAQIQAVEQEIMVALRAGDSRAQFAARDRLYALYPHSDVEASSRYDAILARFNWERQQAGR